MWRRERKLKEFVILSVVQPIGSKEIFPAREHFIHISNDNVANVVVMFNSLRVITSRH